MITKLKMPKFEASTVRRFLYTYKQILAIAFKVNSRRLIIITIISSVWGLTNLPVIYINKLLIDTVIAGIGKFDLTSGLKVILVLVSLRALIEFIRSGLSRFNNNITNTFTEEINAYLETTGGIKLNTLDIPTLESPEFQDKFKKVERESRNRLWGMIGPLSDIPNAVFTVISGFIPLLTFNPWISILVLVVTLPDIFVSAVLAKRDYQAMEYLMPKWRMWGWISDHLTDSRHYYENKILGNSTYMADRLKAIQSEILNHQHTRRMKRAFSRTLAQIPNNLLSLILNAYFFALALIGKITLGTAQLLYQSTNTLAMGFSTFFNDAVSVYENYLFVSDLTWFLGLKSQQGTGKLTPAKDFTQGIEFKDVWFKYPQSKKWVLQGVNFSIGPKENLALVGENGAGKTTLIKLLSGFYRPNKGEILVNGINIARYSAKKYTKLLGVLFQDFSWYPFTAKESIGVGDVKRINNLAEVKKAAKLTGVDEFIEGLPLSYQNPLAKEFEKGVEPSKGQWQRIALARILFRNSRIIILDEPTSNVDPEAEEQIFDKIIDLASDKILILISHRFSSVRRADKILVLNKGKVEEYGNHEELIKKGGMYAKLFNLQAKAYK